MRRRSALDKEPWEPIRISPDGRHVSASLQGSEFVVWDAATGGLVHRHPRPQDRVLFGVDAAADGKGLAWSVQGVWLEGRRGLELGTMYSAVIVADHRTGREWKMTPLPLSVYSGGARFSPDGSKLVLQGGFDGNWKEHSVSVWDVRTGKRLLNRSGATAASPRSACRRTAAARTAAACWPATARVGWCCSR
jgi:hypothetical protein